MGGGEETFRKGGSLAETHHKLIELLQEDIKEEITAWKLPLGDKLWLPAAEALKANTKCRRLTIYECDIGAGESRVHDPCACGSELTCSARACVCAGCVRGCAWVCCVWCAEGAAALADALIINTTLEVP